MAPKKKRKKDNYILSLLNGDDKILEKIAFPLVFILIQLYTLVKLIIPFVRYNNLLIWDMVGHYFSSWYLKDYLLPHISGWNPFFFLGYPQNYFYPPLYSYLSAIFGTILGVELAFKLVLVAVLILTPLAFYYFSRKFSLSKLKSTVLMLAMYAVLFIIPPNEHLGGNMHATFNVGLVGNALALMFLFFYLGKLKESFKTKKFVGTSILMALLVLSHIFTAIVAAIAFVAFATAHIRSKEEIYFSIKHILLTFALTAFWVIPFIVNLGYTRSIQIGYSFIPYMWLFFLISGGYVVYLIYKKDKNFLPIAFFILLFLTFLFVGDSILHLQLHFYRFQVFFYLLVPFVVVSLLGKKDHLFLLLIVVVSVFVMFNVKDLHPEGSLNLPIFYDFPNYNNGRMMVISSPGNQASPHIYQHVVPLRSKNYAVKGLYIESSPNSRYIFDLEKALDSHSLVWGSHIDLKSVTLNYSIIKKQLDLFNINYIFSFYKADESWKKIKRVTFFNNYVGGSVKRYFYEVFKVGDSKLVEVLDYKPKVVKNNWEQEVGKWFLSEKVDHVIVNQDVPNYVGTGTEKIEMVKVSKRQDNLIFKVNSPSPVPILVKISNFPNWRAYQNGKRIPIYRASPHLMLIYGRGKIEMKFAYTFWEILGILLFFLGLFWIITLSSSNKFKNKLNKIKKKIKIKK